MLPLPLFLMLLLLPLPCCCCSCWHCHHYCCCCCIPLPCLSLCQPLLTPPLPLLMPCVLLTGPCSYSLPLVHTHLCSFAGPHLPPLVYPHLVVLVGSAPVHAHCRSFVHISVLLSPLSCTAWPLCSLPLVRACLHSSAGPHLSPPICVCSFGLPSLSVSNIC